MLKHKMARPDVEKVKTETRKEKPPEIYMTMDRAIAKDDARAGIIVQDHPCATHGSRPL
jgi:hypothetical protein